MFLCTLRTRVEQFLPDRLFISLQYKRFTGRRLNLHQPRSFNEKIQWLKLHYRHPLLTQCADKWRVRDFVRERAGSDVLNDVYGVYDSGAQIDASRMPQAFVLKATHGSGWNILCPDKDRIDWDHVRADIDRWLASDYYRLGREWVYKDIRPRIVCERYLTEDSGKPPRDFKFFCFDGEPAMVQVDYDRFEKHTRNLYDLDWRRLPFTLHYPAHTGEDAVPPNLAEMIDVARKLARSFPFVRVDLYSVGGRCLFGELTFYPGNGYEHFRPLRCDRELGDRLRLPKAGSERLPRQA